MPHHSPRIIDEDRAVASRLRRHRRMRGLTQKELAALTGDSEKAISYYESAKTRVSARKMLDLSRALGIPISWLCTDAEEGQIVAACPADSSDLALLRRFIETAEGWELNTAFNRIASARKRDLVVQLVQTLADEQDS
jgi:transcriptional regulator with XRE-family HTH domain